VDIGDLKELLEQLVTWNIGETCAVHKQGPYETCIDFRMTTKLKPLVNA